VAICHSLFKKASLLPHIYSIRDPDFEAETILIVFRVHSFIQMFYDSLVLTTEGILQEVEYFKN
jgi:hypothetical protein